MNTTRLRYWILALVWAIGLPASAAGPTPPRVDAISFSSCQLVDASHFNVLGAECGTLEVPENPAAPQGHKIALHVARIPAINRRKSPDALFLLAGGPGMAASTMYAGVSPAFARIHRNRDIVLVDQRGTGKSNVLNCAFDDEALLRATPAQVEAETQKCLATLNKHANVAFYTTSVAVQDLERVRAALGYEQINLYGGSYGTRVAEHYLRRFPKRTRTLILDGVVAPELALGPEIALDAEAALTNVFERCKRDAACSDRFGDSEATYHALRDALDSHPVPVNFTDPTTGEAAHLDFGPMHFATVLRLSTYSSEQAALLPLVLYLANHSGNYAPMAGQFMLMQRSYGDALAYGMHNSVVCTEDVPFYKPENVDRAKLARTFLGTTQVDSLKSLCNGWPRGPMDADLHAPLKSDVPVLLLSGGNDPVTPPANARKASVGLKHSLHIVLPDLGHGQLGAPCIDRVMAQFVDRASVDNLDTSCTLRATPMPFFTSPAGPSP
ncbi:MAG: alpha/beta fold hydrolase [Gammaproteobacteria bacterium]